MRSVIKRFLAMSLAILMLLSATGCQMADKQEQTTEPPVTESPEDAETLKILMIGDSSGNDAVWLAYDVFQAEQPDRKVVIGNLYYSSCTMKRHAQHAAEDTAAYTYHRNDSGNWVIKENYAISYALEEEHWDVVIIQETNHFAGIADYYKTDDISTLSNYIVDTLGYQPILLWNMLWVNPVGFDEWIFTDPSNPAPTDIPGWKSNYAVNYDNSIDTMYEKIVSCAKDYPITGALTPATAIQHALKVQGIHEQELFRDYTHLSDYGRVMVAYNLYAQIIELADGTAPELTEIKLTTVPSFMRQKRFSALGDLVLTEQQQQSIVEAVNHTVKNPMSIS